MASRVTANVATLVKNTEDLVPYIDQLTEAIKFS